MTSIFLELGLVKKKFRAYSSAPNQPFETETISLGMLRPTIVNCDIDYNVKGFIFLAKKCYPSGIDCRLSTIPYALHAFVIYLFGSLTNKCCDTSKKAK